MIELANRPMAITGASSGIGAATAVACAQAGMPVVVAARRVDRLESLVARIRGGGGRAVAVACDVVNPEQCEAVVERTVREFGSIYGVFANAGYGEEVSMLEMSDDALRAMFETNFFGTMNVVRPAAARMAAAGAGHVVICSSCLALMSIPYYGAYCATKAAQHKIGRAMRMELESKGVHVSTVHPVGTRTEFFDTAATRSQGRSALSSHSSERFMQTPEFVAGRIVKCLRRPRAEVWTGFTGMGVRLGMALCAAAPGVESFVLRRMVRSRMTKANASAGRGNAATPARTQP